MKTVTATPLPATSTPSRREIAARIGLWAVSVVLSAQFAVGGVLKLAGDASMVSMFDDIGAGQSLRVLVGICEVTGAIGLLVPRLARSAAGGLVLLMVGAVVTNVAVLAASPVPPLLFGILAAVVTIRRSRKEVGR